MPSPSPSTSSSHGTRQPSASPAVQVIAMHGWGGDHRGWSPWLEATAGLGWRWSCGERGYGQLEPRQPCWQPEGRRLLIAHSMGPLLLPQDLLADAELVVLLASFSRFVPNGAAGRRLRTALRAMGHRLEPSEPSEPEDRQAQIGRAHV